MTTHLRQRMIEDLQLHGLAGRTQEAYVAAVRQLAEHYGKSPDQTSDEELRQYFLYLTNEKKASSSAITIALCAIKFFYEQTLHQEWPTLTLVRPPREHKLPVILSHEEVQRILKLEDDRVTFRYKGAETGETRHCIVTDLTEYLAKRGITRLEQVSLKPDLLRARTHNALWRNYGFGDKSIRKRYHSSF